MKRTLILLAFIIAIIACKESPSQKLAKVRPDVQSLIDSLVLVNNLPGINFSVILADGSEEQYSSGYEDIEAEIELTSEKVLFSGSVGKTYAVAVLMQLVDEGKLKLGDTYIDYFPDLEWLKRLPNIEEITIEMLLQHTTGLPRWVMKPEVWKALHDDPDRIWSYKDRLSFVFDDEAVHPAGEGWGYSDTNYLLLGMLIEKLAADDYYNILRSRILDPLNLDDTYPSDRRDIHNLSQGYSKLPDEFMIPAKVVTDGKYVFNPQMEWTGGGLASTTSDLAIWARLYYTGAAFSDSLLSRIKGENDSSIKLGKFASYSMGSFIFDTPHGISYGHTGFVPGFNAIFAYYPDKDIAVALQSNCDFAGSVMPLNTYVDLILNRYIEEVE